MAGSAAPGLGARGAGEPWLLQGRQSIAFRALRCLHPAESTLRHTDSFSQENLPLTSRVHIYHETFQLKGE